MTKSHLQTLLEVICDRNIDNFKYNNGLYLEYALNNITVMAARLNAVIADELHEGKMMIPYMNEYISDSAGLGPMTDIICDSFITRKFSYLSCFKFHSLSDFIEEYGDIAPDDTILEQYKKEGYLLPRNTSRLCIGVNEARTFVVLGAI